MDDSERRIREMVEERMGVRRPDARPRWRRWVSRMGGPLVASIVIILVVASAVAIGYIDRAMHRAWYGEHR